jgi:hypothetical protein
MTDEIGNNTRHYYEQSLERALKCDQLKIDCHMYASHPMPSNPS